MEIGRREAGMRRSLRMMSAVCPYRRASPLQQRTTFFGGRMTCEGKPWTDNLEVRPPFASAGHERLSYGFLGCTTSSCRNSSVFSALIRG